MRIFAQNKEVFSWKRPFVVTFLCVSFAAFLFWLDMFRAYEAETKLLVIGKSASVDAGLAAGNLAEVVESLSFYERLIAETDQMEDSFEDFLPDRRRELWNKAVSARIEKGKSVIMIRARGETPEDARLLAKETAETLTSAAGLYYNVKTDLDIRIIDMPSVRAFVVTPVFYVGASLGTALLVTGVFFMFLFLAPRFFGKKTSEPELVFRDDTAALAYHIGDAVPYIDPRKFLPEKPSALLFEKPAKEDIIKKETENQPLVRPSVKAAAPANLPVFDESVPEEAEASLPMPEEVEEALEEISFPSRGEHEIVKAPIILAPRYDEPTVEEYKRRLNELLSGGK